MTKTMLAIAFAASLISAAEAGPSPLRRAVVAFYGLPDNVQTALYRDQCGDNVNAPVDGERAKLGRRDGRRYDAAERKLFAAYAAVPHQTDSELEAVNRDFCRAADDR